MRIKLKVSLPIAPKHGMTAGRVFEVARANESGSTVEAPWWVVGDAGEAVKVWAHEAELLPDEEAQGNDA
jgi:hypothetical protein